MFLKNFFFIKNSPLKHGFFTSLNGLSKKEFKSLNCSTSNDDDKKIVLKNRLIALKNLNLDKKKLILIKQTHSSKVIMINKSNLDQNLEADGMITSLNNVVLGILTADCTPIIIYDDKNKFVCNLHSGWKGSLNNISQQAIKLFENLGNQDITAHVNFDKLIFIANKYNLKIDTFCSQKDFLISCGIQKRMESLQKNKSEEIIKNLNSSYYRLVDNSQMGEIFKVLIISCF